MELVLQHCWSFTHPFWIKMFSIQYCAFRFEWLVATLISLIPLGENTQYRKTFITRGRERYQLYSPVMLCCCFVLPQTSKEIIWVGSFFVGISSNLTLNWILFGKWSPFWSCFVSSSQVTPLQAVLHLMKIYGPFIAWQLGLMLSISFLCKSGLDNYTTTGPWFTDHVYSNGDIFLLKHDEEILVFQNGMCYGNYEQPIPCVTRDGDEPGKCNSVHGLWLNQELNLEPKQEAHLWIKLVLLVCLWLCKPQSLSKPEKQLFGRQ